LAPTKALTVGPDEGPTIWFKKYSPIISVSFWTLVSASSLLPSWLMSKSAETASAQAVAVDVVADTKQPFIHWLVANQPDNNK